jgi:glycerophosphoryl diester phosphodiesterase
MARPPQTGPAGFVVPGFVVQGHRGDRARWPENTVPGFVAALRTGAHAIELDCGLTSDGIVVVCHDPALNPDLTRGPDGHWIAVPGPLIRDTALAALRAFDVGSARPGSATQRRFPAQRRMDGVRIPTLAEVFEAVAEMRGTVDIELKTDPGSPDRTPAPDELADAVVAVARAAGALDRLALRSFDWRGLDHAARRWPHIPLTWLTEAETVGGEWRLGRGGPVPDCLAGLPDPTTWAPRHDELTQEAVGRAHALGLRVVPWTVNDAADLDRLRTWGVDGVCTDDVAMVVDRANRR